MNNFDDENNENSEVKYDDLDNFVSKKNQQKIRERVNKTDFNYIYKKSILTRNICIKANQLSGNIDETLQNILNDEISGVCIEEGYIKPNSCKILLKSEGNLNISNFKGTIYYTVKYEVMVCNPSEGEIIKCCI